METSSFSCTTYFVTLDAFGCKLVLVALCAVDVVLLGDERLGADGALARAAHEALLVPLPRLVLHLLHACTENKVHLHVVVTPLQRLSGKVILLAPLILSFRFYMIL